AEADGLGGLGQHVAALLAAGALDKAGQAQGAGELGDVGRRHALQLAELGDAEAFLGILGPRDAQEDP
ncbi:hypothetical protein RZS08_60490, partial [Arthrospira platensis SPKY1]|nr:hypothetical protein [Arthrospira platensis SPKY1]